MDQGRKGGEEKEEHILSLLKQKRKYRFKKTTETPQCNLLFSHQKVF